MQILPFHEPPKVVDPFMFVPLKRNFVISKDDGVLDLDLFISILVGGLVAIFYFPIYWEESSQLTKIFERGGPTTNQSMLPSVKNNHWQSLTPILSPNNSYFFLNANTMWVQRILNCLFLFFDIFWYFLHFSSFFLFMCFHTCFQTVSPRPPVLVPPLSMIHWNHWELFWDHLYIYIYAICKLYVFHGISYVENMDFPLACLII